MMMLRVNHEMVQAAAAAILAVFFCRSITTTSSLSLLSANVDIPTRFHTEDAAEKY